MMVDLQLLLVPYDTAMRGARMGAGPERLAGALAPRLEARGHQVRTSTVEPLPGPLPAEIRTAFELNRGLASAVGDAVRQGCLPIVMAGNCSTAVGTVAGLGAPDLAVVWFDAHGDFNTPETSVSGFLDGMALAILVGRCWTGLAATVPGFRSVAEERTALVGVRDLDPPEQELLAGSRVTRVTPRDVSRLATVLDSLRARASGAYVHIDLDVLDPEEGRANTFAVGGGPSLEDLTDALRLIADRFIVRAVALTAYDPACDPTGRIPEAAHALLNAILKPPAGAGL